MPSANDSVLVESRKGRSGSVQTQLTWQTFGNPPQKRVRITEGTGRPAAARLFTGTSPGHPRFCALVIITTHSSPWASSRLPADTTSAGRDWRVGRSVYGTAP